MSPRARAAVRKAFPSERRRLMTDVRIDAETGGITGTADKDYNLIWFTEACMSNALRLEIYMKDAQRGGDNELVELFQKAQAESRKGAEQGKQLLSARLSR